MVGTASITSEVRWSILLRDLNKMCIKTDDHTPLGYGNIPENRPINDYLKYGIINLDKPSNPSSHEVVTWVKNILGAEKTGHGGTLDPKVSGVLTICIDRATRLTKSQSTAGKEYVCTIEFHNKAKENKFKNAVEKLTGSLFQRPPLMCAVKRELRLRNVYSVDIVEFNEAEKAAIFVVKCEAGTYIRSLCTHIGMLMGCGAHMRDLRRIRSGCVTEDEVYTLHDLNDAQYIYRVTREEKYLRKIIKPLESLLVEYPRIMIKDSCISAICYGAKLSITGILRYDKNIDVGVDVVLISSKGEAVALAISLVSAPDLEMMKHGIVCKIKRVIMEKDLYPRSWSMKKEYEICSEL